VRRAGKKKFTHQSIFGFTRNQHIKPAIGGTIPMQADSQVVTGQRGGVRTGISVAGDQGEDAEGAAELGLAEGGGFGFAEGAEFAGAALDDGAGDFVRKRGGFGAGALRKEKTWR